MYNEEKALRGVFTKIAASLLFFVLFFNIYSVAYIAGDELVSLFEEAVWLDCVKDIFCSFLYLLSFVLPAVILYKFLPKDESVDIDFSVRLPSPHALFKTLAILFVSIGTIIAFAYFNMWLIPSFSAGGSLIESGKPYQVILLVFSSAVIPAFAEELLFRGAILTNLKPYGKGVAVLVSALLFGVMHMNLSQLLYATAAGVILGVVYVSTESLWLCILIHFANNLFNILENYMFEVFSEEKANLICMTAEIVIFTLGILFALGYVLLKKERSVVSRKLGVFGDAELLKTKATLSGSQVAKAFFCPVMIIFLCVAVVNMLYVLLAQFLMS